jgi:hypothetical protein
MGKSYCEAVQLTVQYIPTWGKSSSINKDLFTLRLKMASRKFHSVLAGSAKTEGELVVPLSWLDQPVHGTTKNETATISSLLFGYYIQKY